MYFGGYAVPVLVVLERYPCDGILLGRFESRKPFTYLVPLEAPFGVLVGVGVAEGVLRIGEFLDYLYSVRCRRSVGIACYPDRRGLLCRGVRRSAEAAGEKGCRPCGGNRVIHPDCLVMVLPVFRKQFLCNSRPVWKRKCIHGMFKMIVFVMYCLIDCLCLLPAEGR